MFGPHPAANGGMRDQRSKDKESAAMVLTRHQHIDGREVIVESPSGTAWRLSGWQAR
jgi:hypothetical protein